MSSLIKWKRQKQIKRSYLIKIARFSQTTLYVIKKVISKAHSNICDNCSLVLLVPFMSEVCLGIILTVTHISKASFLVNKTDARRLSDDATRLRRLVIHRSLTFVSLDLPRRTNFFIFFVLRGVPLCSSLKGNIGPKAINSHLRPPILVCWRHTGVVSNNDWERCPKPCCLRKGASSSSKGRHHITLLVSEDPWEIPQGFTDRSQTVDWIDGGYRAPYKKIHYDEWEESYLEGLLNNRI